MCVCMSAGVGRPIMYCFIHSRLHYMMTLQGLGHGVVTIVCIAGGSRGACFLNS